MTKLKPNPALVGCLPGAILALAAIAVATAKLQAREPLPTIPPSLVLAADDQTSGYRANTMYVCAPARPGALTALDFSTFPPGLASGKCSLQCNRTSDLHRFHSGRRDDPGGRGDEGRPNRPGQAHL